MVHSSASVSISCGGLLINPSRITSYNVCYTKLLRISSSATPYTMNYEVAQTNPVITGVTPPTVEGGFGSTSNGAYGNLNIQKYIKIVK